MLIALQRQVAETNETAEFRADEVFTIHIGKTPPRKQHEWFSFDRADNVIWMSIKDMGNAGAYLIDSSEYLTRQAVEKYNIQKCQPGSILLSFKLTIGRVGIVANEMVTNEAIACFASDDQRKLAYLYPLLLTYDYASMGSTSSIATAVNSKMVKAMPLKMPGENALDDYFKQAKPILDLLLSSTREIAALEQLRDTLLPKLMSGEINVSEIELPMQPNSHLSGFKNVYYRDSLARLFYCRQAPHTSERTTVVRKRRSSPLRPTFTSRMSPLTPPRSLRPASRTCRPQARQTRRGAPPSCS